MAVTPRLLLDHDRLLANLGRLDAALAGRGVDLRPHLKTAKAAEVAALATRNWSGAVTVSTLEEAEAFVAVGCADLLYAVGCTEAKLPRLAALAATGARVGIIVDDAGLADRIAARITAGGMALAVHVEIDVDGHRSGVDPAGDALLAIAAALARHGVPVAGVMTHAGESYACRDAAALRRAAAAERDGAVRAAWRLRAAGHACPVVSVGSTPTALAGIDLAGITEIRAGVYMFMDLTMAAIGVCTPDDIALAVLATVIGQQQARNQLIIDAGWMALSQDRGADGTGFGVLRDDPLGDLFVARLNQEQGIITTRSGAPIDLAASPVGRELAILPNHACATAAQFSGYDVVGRGVSAGTRWQRLAQR